MTDEARDLAARNIRICAYLARMHHARYRLDMDEAISIAREALCLAAVAYVGKRETACKFVTYAINAIVHAFGTSIRKRSTMGRDWSRTVSMEAGRDGMRIGDIIGEDGGLAELEGESLRRFEGLLAVLPPREAEVLRLTFGAPDKPPTFEQVGKAIGMSDEGARFVQRKALDRLRFLANSLGLLSTKHLIVREVLAR